MTGYYNIGAVTGGLQAGIRNASQVYVFRTEQALNDLKKGSDWKVGATAGLTIVKADATARGTTGDVVAYVFDSKGLQGGISLDLLDIWKAGKKPPRE